jgi:hypothetical protein
VDYRFSFREPIVTVEVTGDATMGAIMEAVRVLLQHPEWERGLPVLWDLTQIRSLAVTPESLRGLAAADSALMEEAGPGRTALVMRPNADFDLGTLYTLLIRNPIRTHRVFDSTDEARRWLSDEPGSSG